MPYDIVELMEEVEIKVKLLGRTLSVERVRVQSSSHAPGEQFWPVGSDANPIDQDERRLLQSSFQSAGWGFYVKSCSVWAGLGRVSVADGAGDGSVQPAGRGQLTVTVYKDLLLQHYGFEICPNLPLTIASVTAGSTAEGKLQPGDQLLLINSTAVDNLSVEQAADIIRRDWGIENFISPTLLRNMRGKDIKKAISYHMKRNQLLLDPRQKLQDRESYVALLVGAKYGVSQIINNKLNIVTSLAEFANISRVELAEESEKVSTVKIYLQDLKSRTCSDSEDSWELDSSSEQGPEAAAAPGGARPACEALGEPRSPDKDRRKERAPGGDPCDGGDNATDSTSEASDSANTESRGFKTSGSSDSMDALEEDELEACSSSRPELFHFYMPTVQEMSSSDKSFFPVRAAGGCSGAGPRDYFCFLQVPLAEEPGREDDPSEQRQEDSSVSALGTKLSEGNTMGYYSLCYSTSPAESVERSDTSHSPQRSPWRDPSAQEDSPCRAERTAEGTAEVSELTLEPPPGFGDTSSEEEFYDAADRLSPPEARAAGYNPSPREGTDSPCVRNKPGSDSSGQALVLRQTAREKHRREKELACAQSLRKRRSFLQTDYTSQVTFPLGLPGSVQNRCSWPPPAPASARPPAPPSAGDTGEDAELGLQARGDRSPYSDLVEMEPDAMETKSVTESVVSPISAVRLPVFDVLLTYRETRSWPAALKAGVSSGKGYVLPDAVEQLGIPPCDNAQENSLFCDVKERRVQENQTPDFKQRHEDECA
ncbi:FERM and PDZ domain-containing protein 1 [Patagioenas fasciata monilis]|uniref:FERM and PDZ domain-containing protein 1 n=1 Tax=Patagioenas fasciata monilis TaxID=372326 RepID=A0A1V4L0M8_PATFA|nr:FERM and PDZ domain-containing protein 1 [Patagioenas fasciata monilis]